jgi:hypothetical protein
MSLISLAIHVAAALAICALLLASGVLPIREAY